MFCMFSFSSHLHHLPNFLRQSWYTDSKAAYGPLSVPTVGTLTTTRTLRAANVTSRAERAPEGKKKKATTRGKAAASWLAGAAERLEHFSKQRQQRESKVIRKRNNNEKLFISKVESFDFWVKKGSIWEVQAVTAMTLSNNTSCLRESRQIRDALIIPLVK